MGNWVKTVHINEFDSKHQVVAKLNSNEVLLLKSHEEYFALASKCPHLGMGLKGGKVDHAGKAITCPWHDSQFCMKTGKVRSWVTLSGIKKYLLFFIPKKTPINASVYNVKIEDDYLLVKPD